MPSAVRPWSDSQDAHSFREVAAIAACPAKLFRLLKCHNAWHGRWSQSTSLFQSLQAAQNQAEGMRKRGTTWSVFEEPVLAVLGLGASDTLLIAEEPDVRAPLLGARLVCAPDLTLAEVARHFQPKAQRRFARYLVQQREVALGASPCVNHLSYSSGGNYLLGWDPKVSDRHFAGILEVVVAFADVPPRP